jgi:hypothetical protein
MRKRAMAAVLCAIVLVTWTGCDQATIASSR